MTMAPPEKANVGVGGGRLGGTRPVAPFQKKKNKKKTQTVIGAGGRTRALILPLALLQSHGFTKNKTFKIPRVSPKAINFFFLFYLISSSRRVKKKREGEKKV